MEEKKKITAKVYFMIKTMAFTLGWDPHSCIYHVLENKTLILSYRYELGEGSLHPVKCSEAQETRRFEKGPKTKELEGVWTIN